MKSRNLAVRKTLQLEKPAVMSGEGKIEFSQTYEDESSYQTVAADLDLDAAAGTSEEGDSAYIGSIMGHVMGAALTKTKNIIAGLIGKFTVTGVRGSTYPLGGVVGEIGDGVTEADGAFVAVLGGDSEQTNVRAMYTVDNQNSTPGSGADYGLDLKGVDHDSYGAVAYLKAGIRLPNDICILFGAGVPTTGASGTGDDFAGKGSLYIDITNANHYIQVGAITSPDWKLVTRAS